MLLISLFWSTNTTSSDSKISVSKQMIIDSKLDNTVAEDLSSLLVKTKRGEFWFVGLESDDFFMCAEML